MKKRENYSNHAPKKLEFTIRTGGFDPNPKNKPGESVEEHERLETANILLAEGEMGQQNNNL